MNSFLLQPYPFYYGKKSLFVISGVILIMSLFFNYFFEPFEVNTSEHRMEFFWISFIHAAIPAIILFTLSIFFKVIKAEENWTIKKETGYILISMLLIGFVQFLIRDIIYENANNWSLKYLYEEIRNTFLVGILFVLILVPLNFNRLYSKNINNANILNDSHDLLMPKEDLIIVIKTKLKNENLELCINNFVFAKADGNYVELYINEEGKTNKILKRITFKELELALKPHSNIIKTHRSYLVNKYHILNITGNAQGYKLQLSNFKKNIPVSRNMIAHFNTLMKSN